MKKLFTVHIQNWRINGKFYITENSTGKKVGFFSGMHEKGWLIILETTQTQWRHSILF